MSPGHPPCCLGPATSWVPFQAQSLWYRKVLKQVEHPHPGMSSAPGVKSKLGLTKGSGGNTAPRGQHAL